MQRECAGEIVMTEPPEETLTITVLFFQYQVDVHMLFTVH